MPSNKRSYQIDMSDDDADKLGYGRRQNLPPITPVERENYDEKLGYGRTPGKPTNMLTSKKSQAIIDKIKRDKNRKK
jgi:hypothetical protein